MEICHKLPTKFAMPKWKFDGILPQTSHKLPILIGKFVGSLWEVCGNLLFFPCLVCWSPQKLPTNFPMRMGSLWEVCGKFPKSFPMRMGSLWQNSIKLPLGHGNYVDSLANFHKIPFVCWQVCGKFMANFHEITTCVFAMCLQFVAKYHLIVGHFLVL